MLHSELPSKLCAVVLDFAHFASIAEQRLDQMQAVTRFVRAVLVVVASVGLLGAVEAQTTLAPTISGTVSYAASNGPFIVSGNTIIAAASTVTFGAGSIIQFQPGLRWSCAENSHDFEQALRCKWMAR